MDHLAITDRHIGANRSSEGRGRDAECCAIVTGDPPGDIDCRRDSSNVGCDTDEFGTWALSCCNVPHHRIRSKCGGESAQDSPNADE